MKIDKSKDIRQAIQNPGSRFSGSQTLIAR
jgi:hypothetical protein